MIGTVLADPGYASDTNLAAPGPPRLIALGKNRDQLKAAHQTPACRSAAAFCAARTMGTNELWSVVACPTWTATMT